VHGVFVTWFTWGFINAALSCFFCLSAGISARCMPALTMCCAGLFSCVQCSGHVWYIMGLVWRLRESGRFAAGDIKTPATLTDAAWETELTKDGSLYQTDSGNFMWTYFVITWILMGVSCLCACVGPCIVACLNK